MGVEYNGSLTFDVQNAEWDDIQEVYGMGFSGAYSPTATSGTNSSWGAKADDFLVEYFDHEKRPFYMYPSNTSDFFRTGLTAQNTAILSVNSGKTGIRFSVTDVRNKDILPSRSTRSSVRPAWATSTPTTWRAPCAATSHQRYLSISNPFIVWKNIPNIDPDSGYNTSGLGLEYGSLPSRLSYGINVNLKF